MTTYNERCPHFDCQYRCERDAGHVGLCATTYDNGFRNHWSPNQCVAHALYFYQCVVCQALHCAHCRIEARPPEGVEPCIKTLGYTCPTCTRGEERRFVLDGAIASLHSEMKRGNLAPGMYDVLAIALECRATWRPLSPEHEAIFTDLLRYYRGPLGG